MIIYTFKNPDLAPANKALSADAFMHLFGNLIPTTSRIAFSVGHDNDYPRLLTGISIGYNYSPGIFTMCTNWLDITKVSPGIALYNAQDIYQMVVNLISSNEVSHLPIIFYMESVLEPYKKYPCIIESITSNTPIADLYSKAGHTVSLIMTRIDQERFKMVPITSGLSIQCPDMAHYTSGPNPLSKIISTLDTMVPDDEVSAILHVPDAINTIISMHFDTRCTSIENIETRRSKDIIEFPIKWFRKVLHDMITVGDKSVEADHYTPIFMMQNQNSGDEVKFYVIGSISRTQYTGYDNVTPERISIELIDPVGGLCKFWAQI